MVMDTDMDMDTDMGMGMDMGMGTGMHRGGHVGVQPQKVRECYRRRGEGERRREIAPGRAAPRSTAARSPG